VRAGTTKPEPEYVLSVNHPERIMHVKIAIEDGYCIVLPVRDLSSDLLYLFYVMIYDSVLTYQGTHRFESIVKVIEHYRMHDYATNYRLSGVCPAPAPVVSAVQVIYILYMYVNIYDCLYFCVILAA
jgi:hypothetical protein